MEDRMFLPDGSESEIVDTPRTVQPLPSDSSASLLTTRGKIARSHPALNRVRPQDRAIHDWYRFVLAFPPHLVREYLERFRLSTGAKVLDPFCGTGTVLVECKKAGISSVGVEAHPMPCFASQTKIDWSIDPNDLVADASRIAGATLESLRKTGIPEDPDVDGVPTPLTRLKTLPHEQHRLLLTDSISARPLHKALSLLEMIQSVGNPRFRSHQLLALATTLVNDASNLAFGPEVGLGKIQEDARVVVPWLERVHTMATDLGQVAHDGTVLAMASRGDSRRSEALVEPGSIDAVITSPPYPNEKDYTRTTRLESVILGFIRSRGDLRTVKEQLIRSNTRGVYKMDNDDILVHQLPEVRRISTAIEERRKQLGKTSGFERLYPRVAALYFGGMHRHLLSLQPILRPGARLAYVVGDQASYLQVKIRTGEILCMIAETLGYQIEDICLFRNRFSTATQTYLREEVVVLKWQPINVK